jgi:hypothetical protein
LIVEASIASLKVAVTTVLGHIPLARLSGDPDATVGGVHVVALVVKDQIKLLASGTPYWSMAPVVIVAV